MTRSLSLALCLAVALAGQPAPPDPRCGAVGGYYSRTLPAVDCVGGAPLILVEPLPNP